MKKALCIGALVAALSAGAFWYGRKAEPKSQYLPSVAVVPVAEPGQDDFVMNMNHEAMRSYRDGLERMRNVGVEYTSEQVQVMLRCADKDYNPKDMEHRLDVDEARELYEVVLNPDSYLGRIAMPKKGGSPPLVRMPPRYEPLLRALIDYDRNGVATAEEMRRAHARIGE